MRLAVGLLPLERHVEVAVETQPERRRGGRVREQVADLAGHPLDYGGGIEGTGDRLACIEQRHRRRFCCSRRWNRRALWSAIATCSPRARASSVSALRVRWSRARVGRSSPRVSRRGPRPARTSGESCARLPISSRRSSGAPGGGRRRVMAVASAARPAPRLLSCSGRGVVVDGEAAGTASSTTTRALVGEVARRAEQEDTITSSRKTTATAMSASRRSARSFQSGSSSWSSWTRRSQQRTVDGPSEGRTP